MGSAGHNLVCQTGRVGIGKVCGPAAISSLDHCQTIAVYRDVRFGGLAADIKSKRITDYHLYYHRACNAVAKCGALCRDV